MSLSELSQRLIDEVNSLPEEPELFSQAYYRQQHLRVGLSELLGVAVAPDPEFVLSFVLGKIMLNAWRDVVAAIPSTGVVAEQPDIVYYESHTWPDAQVNHLTKLKYITSTEVTTAEEELWKLLYEADLPMVIITKSGMLKSLKRLMELGRLPMLEGKMRIITTEDELASFNNVL